LSTHNLELNLTLRDTEVLSRELNKAHLRAYFIQFTNRFWNEDSSFVKTKFVVLVVAVADM
jgi:hypothetical protein